MIFVVFVEMISTVIDHDANMNVNCNVQWSWNRRDDIWYQFDENATRLIERAYLQSAKSTSIECVTYANKTKLRLQIIFNDEMIAHWEDWQDGEPFSKYFYQKNHDTNAVRVVRRLDMNEKASFAAKTVIKNYFE